MTKRPCGDEINFTADLSFNGSINNNNNLNTKKTKTEEYDMSTLNGTHGLDGISDNDTANNNNNGDGVSHVVHLRNIPIDSTESDLFSIGSPFGKIAATLMMARKNQALIEFADIKSANVMVNYWANNQVGIHPTIRGRNIFVQYSNHQHLKQEQLNGGNGNGANTGTNNINNNPMASSTSAGLQHHPQHMQQEEQTPVLRVVVESMQYPVNLDGFHQMFSRFGKVCKIVTFNKNGTFQALIQFDSVISAVQAKTALDGQPMYAPQVVNANIFRVGFSKLPNLNVKYNNEKSRDYTNPSLPSGNSGAPATVGVQQVPLHGPPANMYGAGDFGPEMMAPLQLGGNMAMNHHHHHHHQAHQQQQQQQQNMYGGGGHHNGGRGGPFGPAIMGGRGDMMSNNFLTGPVVLVSNIPEQIANPDALFTLFGLYGDVHRVKVLYNKKDNALIQMANVEQCAQAIHNLSPVDKSSGIQPLRLYGKHLKIAPSKHAYVQLPKEGTQPDAGLTKEYLNSPLHRFKKLGSKNYNNIFPPSTTLHLSNIPSSVEEADLRRIFAETLPAGEESIMSFRFFSRDRKMALISLATMEDSIMALTKLHNYQLEESSHLRVSFSKSSI